MGSDKILTFLLFTITAVTLAIPAVYLAFGATGTFSASATVGNEAPTVAVDSGQVATGAAGTSRDIYIYFNATDANGYGDLNDASAQVVINRSSETSRTSSACEVLSHPNAQTTRYNCTVALQYYDGAGAWTINASVDDSATTSTDTSKTLTVNTLDAVSVVTASISFSGSPGTSNVAASPNPQRLNNTGNQNYASISVTGYSFVSGANVIDVGNVTMNVSDSGGNGEVLVNDSAVALSGSTLNKGDNSVRAMYFYLDIPASQPAGSYNAQSAWILEATT